MGEDHYPLNPPITLASERPGACYHLGAYLSQSQFRLSCSFGNSSPIITYMTMTAASFQTWRRRKMFCGLLPRVELILFPKPRLDFLKEVRWASRHSLSLLERQDEAREAMAET